MDNYISGKKSNKIKYIAVILMIILHLFSNPAREYISLFSINGETIEHIFTKFCGICVGIFVFLSGYGLMKKYNSNISYKNILKKILKFYINYWYIFLIFIPIGLAIGSINFDIKRLILNFFALISDYNYEWWFVILYVQLLLVYPILNKLLNKQNTPKAHTIIYIASLIISIGAKAIYKQYVGNMLINIFVPLFMYQFIFVTAMIIARDGIFDKVQKRINTNNKCINALVLLVVVVFMNIIGYIPVIGKIINPMLIPIFIYILAKTIKEPQNITIYKTSTNIWLIHTFFTTYYFPDIIWNLKYSVLIIVWTIILTTSISLILDKILDKIYKVIKI